MVLKESKDNGIKISFSAAYSEAKVLFYKIKITDIKEGAEKEFRVLGNWVDINKGVVVGSTHKDAKAFEYELPPVVSDNESCVISVSAVDEYGNESKPLIGKLS